MMRVAVLALACLAARPAGAVLVDDLLAAGYTVVAATRVPGSFGGCVRQRRLVFADGSVFACSRTQAQTAYEPRVYVLRLAGGPPCVVLAGSAVMAGQLLRLRAHDYRVPLRMDPDPLPGRPVTHPDALHPGGAVAGIDALTRQQNAPLQQQQQDRPARPRSR